MSLCKICRKASKHVHDWISRRTNLQEESITDWLLDNISTQTNQIAYYPFNKHEEAKVSGADWDWWVLFGHSCFKLRIQAKRAKDNRDHYRDIARSNRYGLQIELLMNSSTRLNFYPMYAFFGHSCGNERCIREGDVSGIFITSALDVYKAVIAVPRRNVPKDTLLSLCIPFHCLFCCPLVHDGRSDGFENLFHRYFEYPRQPGEGEPSLERSELRHPGFEEQTPRFILALLEGIKGENASGMIREYQSMFPESNGIMITRHRRE